MKNTVKKMAAEKFGSYSKFSSQHLQGQLWRWVAALEKNIAKYNKVLNLIGLELVLTHKK